jgi:hypothetical protein
MHPLRGSDEAKDDEQKSAGDWKFNDDVPQRATKSSFSSFSPVSTARANDDSNSSRCGKPKNQK